MAKINYPAQLQVELLPEGALPDFIFELPEMQLPEKINMAEYFLDRNLAGEHADHIAYYSGERVITYRTLYDWVNRFANGLRGLGIGEGDRVMLRIPTCVEFVVAAMALHRLGAVVVPTMTLIREKALTFIANNSESKAIICTQELMGEIELGRGKHQTVENIIVIGGDQADVESKGYRSYQGLIESSSAHIESVQFDRDALAAMFFSSGTTGSPKGSMHLNRTLICSVLSLPYAFRGVEPTDVIAGSPPLAFTFGYGYNMLLPLLCGIPSVLIEGRVSAEGLFEAIQKYKVTLFNSAPTAYNQMLNLPDADKYDTSSLRLALSGSAPLLPNTIHKWISLTHVDIMDTIGSSETFVPYLATWKPESKLGSIGFPIPGGRAKIIDDDGKEAAPNAIGRLAFKACAGVMYWRNPERQLEAVVDGWSLTGDLAYKDDDGCFFHVSRSDDLIKSRGYRVSPGEVEDALKEHAGVYDAAIIGVPDEVQGHRVKAFIVLKDGFEGSPALVEEMRSFVKARVAPYQAPSEIEYVKALPMTETGKIRRVELRELEAKRAAERQKA